MTLLYRRAWGIEYARPGAAGQRYDDLDMTFRAQYSVGVPATCDVTLYNPGPAILGALGSRDTLWRVLAGYVDGGESEVLAGTVVTGSVEDRSTSADPMVSFQLAASRGAVFATTLSRAWSNVRASEVIDYIRREMGLSFDVYRLARDVIYGRGYTVLGAPLSALSEVVADCGCQYQISSGKLRIWPLGEQARVVTADLWSDSTGLIDAQGPADQTTIRATALLRGWVRPGDAIRVLSPAYNGDVIATEITHEGDTSGDRWYTSIVGAPR